MGHEQLRLAPPGVLFDAALEKVRASRPGRVVGVSFGSGERTFHWARLARTAAPDGTRVFFDARADTAANRLDLDFEGPIRIRLDLPGSGLDAATPVAIHLSGEGRLDLALAGPFAPALQATLDGIPLNFERTPEGALLSALLPRPAGSLLVVSPAPAGPVAEADLLVPSLVRAEGANGARYATVLTVGNVSESPLLLEALLLDGASQPFALSVPARSSRAFPSDELLAQAPAGSVASPLRLRVVSGDAGAVVASARVFNATAVGTYGLSFPVLPAGASVLAGGATAHLFAPADSRQERTNVSLFAPFEASTAEVTLLDAAGSIRRSHRLDLAPLRRLQLDDAAPGWTVPAVASAPGRSGVFFRSDLFLFSPGGSTLDVALLPRDGSPAETVRLALRAGETRFVPDVLATLFPSKVPGAGALVLSSSGGLLPLAVTRSEPETGPSSQDLSCIPRGAEAAPGRPVAFAGVDESPAARSNLVLVAPAAASRVGLALYAADGLRGELVVEVGAGRVVQLDSVAVLLPGGAVEGATLVVRAEGGPVVASVARIDNGSNDPAGLAPLPLAAP